MQIAQHFDTLKSCDPASAHTTSMSLGECGRVVIKSVSLVLLRLAPQYSVFRLVYLISEHLVCFTDTFNVYIIGF